MIKTLTQKQERFCLEIVKGTSQADAYRAAFKPKKAKAKTIHEEASHLMANPKVATRIQELMKPVVSKAQLTREEWIEDAVRLYRGDVRKLFDAHGNPVPIPELGDSEAALLEGFEVVEDYTKVTQTNGSSTAVPTGYTSKYKVTSKKARHDYVGKALGFSTEKANVDMTLAELVLGSYALEEEDAT